MIETRWLSQTTSSFLGAIAEVVRAWRPLWSALIVWALFSAQTAQAQDPGSNGAERYGAGDLPETEQTIPQNEWYAKARRFLDAKDYANALPLMRKAAEADHLLAMNDLGDMYYSGEGVPQEYEKAFEWYRTGAMAGNVLAMANLAYLYEHGWGVARDDFQARAWYRKAAAAGDQDSIHNLKLLDPNGQAVVQDEAQTREWYQRRAFAGDAAAMYKLGGMYADGQGVSQDYAKAAEWYLKAARSGLGEAMNDLGYLYAKGQGVPADESKAREWYQKAAEAGNAVGLQNLKQLNSIDNFFQSADRVARMLFWASLFPAATILFIAMGRYSGQLPSRFAGPSRVKLALLLLWTNLTLALVSLVVASFFDQNLGSGIGCFGGVVAIGLHSILLRFIGKGSNAARIILLVTVLLAIPMLPALAKIASASPRSATFTIVGLALNGLAIFLLFSGGSGYWFTSRRRTGMVTVGQPQAG